MARNDTFGMDAHLSPNPGSWRSALSPTKASLARHSPHLLKRNANRSGLPFNSPSKSLPSKATQHDRFQSRGRPNQLQEFSGNRNGKSSQGILPGSPAHKRPGARQYLSENEKLFNDLSDSQRVEGQSLESLAKDHAVRRSPPASLTDKLAKPSMNKRFDGANRSVLSRTPPPFSLDADVASDPPLPPAREAQQRKSPSAIRRDYENIFSSGNRKSTKRVEWPFDDTNRVTRTAKRKLLPIEPGNYFNTCVNRLKSKNHLAYLGRLDTVRQDVMRLDEEVLVERRRAAVFEKLHVGGESQDGIQSLIDQCIALSDKRIGASTKPIPNTSPGILAGPLPLRMPTTSQNYRTLSPLTFTGNIHQLAPQKHGQLFPSQRRIIRGYSHNRLMYFHIILDISPAPLATVSDMSITCSEWAQAEVLPFLQDAAVELDMNRALYAISSFTELAANRARVWSKLRCRFPGLLDLSDLSQSENTYGDNENSMDRKAITSNISRRIMTFRRRNLRKSIKTDSVLSTLEVTITWDIRFDASGEARSDVSANTTLSPRVANLHENNQTKQISSILNSLVSDYGVLEGVSSLMLTLFPGDHRHSK